MSADLRAQGWTEVPEVDDFATLIGPLWSRPDGSSLRYGFVAQQKHMSRFNRLHGGMVMWFADKTMSMKAQEAAGDPRQMATVQLDVHFIGTVAKDSFIESACEVVRKTGSLLFVSGRLLCAGEPVASASGVWKYRT